MTDDSRKIRRLISALSRFSQFDPKMQVSTIMTLLEIAAADAEKRDITPGDIERRVGLKTGTASRNVFYWGEGHKEITGAHEMLDVVQAPGDRRMRHIRLNAKGKAFVNQILGALGDG